MSYLNFFYWSVHILHIQFAIIASKRWFTLMFPLMMLVAMTSSEPILVGTITGEQEDTCSLYPLCSDYGQGKHQILAIVWAQRIDGAGPANIKHQILEDIRYWKTAGGILNASDGLEKVHYRSHSKYRQQSIFFKYIHIHKWKKYIQFF